MDTVITYSLRQDEDNSDTYYRDVKELAERVKQHIEKQFDKEISCYQIYIKNNSIEEVRSKEEYGLELLVLGVLWHVYGKRALCYHEGLGQKTLHFIVQKRKHAKQLKGFYSYWKGKLSTRYLLDDHVFDEKGVLPIRKTSEIKQLLTFLSASGEFDEECVRLTPWYHFIEAYKEWEGLLEKVVDESEAFCLQCDKQLKRYIPHVSQFIQVSRQTHKDKEDMMMVQRQPIEYYLNMVGAEILNGAFRSAFLRTTERYVFLPACMTYKPHRLCQRKEGHKGYICGKCSHECPIYQTSQIAQAYDAQTVIVEHESELYRTKAIQQGERKGVVGIACVLNLLSGGWKAVQLGYIPQCVLLDYCGCQQHWHEKGIMTEINQRRLRSVLGNG